MRNFFVLLLLMGISQIWGQVSPSPWQPLTSSLPALSVSSHLPNQGHVFTLERDLLRSQLQQAPNEQIQGLSQTVLSLPFPDGSLKNFHLVEAPIMHTSLEQRYDLHTYSASGQINPSHRARISLTPKGFHAMIFTPEGVVYVDPLSTNGKGNTYVSYWRKDLPAPMLPGGCGTDDVARTITTGQQRGSLGSELYVYRLALSATAAYTDFHGGTLTDAMAAITVALTRINGIFENELGIRLELIPNNDQLIFIGTDSFSDNDLFANLGENQQVIDAIIGSNNYDVGHVFTQIDPGPGGSFTAGVAFPGVICNSGLKAQGASSLPSPIGDGFYLVAAHELGHQFSAGHTWNANSGSCTGGQYSPSTAWEPGSGSTIMAYPGVCGAHNITSIRDGYFHGGTVEQIFEFSRTGPGSNCPQIIQTGNQPPELQLPEDGKTIPYGTPFVLEGTATDANGDSLSYCWEQLDLGPAGDPDFPLGNAPLFRSFLPKAEGVRYFPDLVSFASAGFIQAGERLPDYDRNLQFRLTVRDNRAGGGGVSWDEVAYSVTTQAGPFVVISPNENTTTWRVGQRQKVRWDVAQTHLPPVNSKQISIFLSTDGGLTYPIELLTGTPNDGEAEVIVPDEVSSACRIMVRASDNIFLDISDENFSIEPAPTPDFSLYLATESLAFCAGDTLEIPVQVSPQAGLTGEVRVIAGTLPADVEAIVRVDTVLAGETATLVLTTPSTFTGVTAILQLVGASTSASDIISVPLNIGGNIQAEPILLSPLEGTRGNSRQPVLSWEAAEGAISYVLEVSSTADFQSLAILAEDLTETSWKISQPLAQLTTYYWRVKATNSCGSIAYSPVSAFQTGDCRILSNQDGPFELPTFGAPNQIESQIQLGAFGNLTDVNVLDIQAAHPEVDDLRLRLVSPNGTAATLFNGNCGEESQHLRISYDNESDLGTAPCPPTDGRAYTPVEPIDVFYGQSTLGTWRMQVTDVEDFDAGTFYGWKLEFCTELPDGPDLIQNAPLMLSIGGLRTIRDTLLEAIDSQFGPADVTFTLVATPTEGNVLLYGQPLQAGETFTQRDINLGGLLYEHTGSSSGMDMFRFDIQNPNAGWAGLYSFRIDRTVGIDGFEGTGVRVYPNPAREKVIVATPTAPLQNQPLSLYDVSGRVQQTIIWPAGKEEITISVADLTPGIYFLRGLKVDGAPVKLQVIR